MCLLPAPAPVPGLCSWVSLVLCLLPCGQLRVGGGQLGRGFCPPRRDNRKGHGFAASRTALCDAASDSENGA